MGEAKRRREQAEQAATVVTGIAADSGALVLAGWLAFQETMLKTLPRAEHEKYRWAFMAGAEHLFSSIMNVMDAGEEPTEADMRRMEAIDREIQAWRKEAEIILMKAEGNG